MSPYWTHPLTAGLRFAIVLTILALCNVPGAHWLAFAYVAGHFEGREADDAEHRLKNSDWDKSTGAQLLAWFGAAFWWRWYGANFAQAAAAIVPVLVATLIISAYGGIR